MRAQPILPPSNAKIIFILTIGVVSVSASAIFIRLAIEAVGNATIAFSLFLATSRLILASVVLIPNWFCIQTFTVLTLNAENVIQPWFAIKK